MSQPNKGWFTETVPHTIPVVTPGYHVIVNVRGNTVILATVHSSITMTIDQWVWTYGTVNNAIENYQPPRCNFRWQTWDDVTVGLLPWRRRHVKSPSFHWCSIIVDDDDEHLSNHRCALCGVHYGQVD